MQEEGNGGGVHFRRRKPATPPPGEEHPRRECRRLRTLRCGAGETARPHPGGRVFCVRGLTSETCSSTSPALAFSGRCALWCKLAASNAAVAVCAATRRRVQPAVARQTRSLMVTREKNGNATSLSLVVVMVVVMVRTGVYDNHVALYLCTGP